MKQRGKVQTKEADIRFIGLKMETKRHIVKNRGLIVKNKSIEVNYLVDSLYFRRRLTIFITFRCPLERANILIVQKSIKFWKNTELIVDSPI